MTFSIHPLAEQDLADAAAFYERSATAAVAARFFDEVGRACALLDDNPGFGTAFDLPQRIYPLRVFPYSVVYRPTDQGIRVLAVRHQHRAPGVGRGRT